MLLRNPIPALLSAAAALSSLALAETTTTVTLAITPSQLLSNPHVLPASTHATLTSLHTRHSAPLTTENSFVFGNVSAGSYLADVHSPSHGFVPLRVDVTQQQGEGGVEGKLTFRAWETYRGNDWDNKGEEAARVGGGGGGGVHKNAVEVRTVGPKVVFTERGSFSVFSILKNPMILMSVVSLGLFIGLPKMVENMDPEARAEFEERQKGNPMASLTGGGGGSQNPMDGFDMASFLSGHSNKGGSGNSEAGAGAAAAGAGTGGGGKKNKR